MQHGLVVLVALFALLYFFVKDEISPSRPQMSNIPIQRSEFNPANIAGDEVLYPASCFFLITLLPRFKNGFLFFSPLKKYKLIFFFLLRRRKNTRISQRSTSVIASTSTKRFATASGSFTSRSLLSPISSFENL